MIVFSLESNYGFPLFSKSTSFLPSKMARKLRRDWLQVFVGKERNKVKFMMAYQQKQ